MAVQSGQKFINQNRAPRVQIEYDLELEGAQKKVDLPFVMGVMADLSGNPKEPLEDAASRKFLQIDVDNFDERMKAAKPRVAVTVPNTLTGEGNLSLDLAFESLDDFSPEKIASKVDPLKNILEQRRQLHALKTRIDGKAKVEEELGKILGDKAKLDERSKAKKKV
jgi:type VI secretion system protein ImpB